MREVGLLLGQFADARLTGLSEDELDQLGHFMEAQDADILSWNYGDGADGALKGEGLMIRL
jgi:antitoxin CptB